MASLDFSIYFFSSSNLQLLLFNKLLEVLNDKFAPSLIELFNIFYHNYWIVYNILNFQVNFLYF